jgi:hypothetical protein
MNKFNDFNFLSKNSIAYPLRWFVILSIVLTCIMGYANMIGWRLLTFDNQEKWSASGSGTHK